MVKPFDHSVWAQFTLPSKAINCQIATFSLARAKATNGMITAFLFSTSP
jgi:hypothetical protein